MAPTDPKTVFVIVPAYNEGPVLRQTLLPLIAQGYAVVVVDDASTDDTPTVLRGLGVHGLRHPINLGQGAALQTGMTYALQQGAQYLVHFDADGQHDYREIPALLEPLRAGRADITLGTRFRRPEDVRAVPPLRRLLLRLAIVFNGLITGLWLTDAHNGFRAMTRAAAQALRLTENRMAHATELLSLIRLHGLRVEEVPVHIEYTAYSRQKGQHALHSFNILLDLITKKLLS